MKFLVEFEELKTGKWSIEVRGYHREGPVLHAATVRAKGFDDAFQWAQARIKDLGVE